MKKDDSERSTGSSVVDKGLGILDRAWDAHWSLRLTCFILFVDMAMVLRSGHGLSQWSAGNAALLTDVGWIAITLVAFSLASAIVIPVLVHGVRDVAMAIWVYMPILFRSGDNGRVYQRPLGYVPAKEFHNLALRDRDALLLGIYNDHERERWADREARNHWGQLTAAALIVALADWRLAGHFPGSVSLIGALIGTLGPWSSVIVPLVVLCAGFILKWAWFSDVSPDLIYYPPLDEELRRKEREKRGPL